MNNIDSFQLLSQIFWCRIFTLFQDHLTENLGEIHKTNKNFTSAASNVHRLLISNGCRSDVISVCNAEKWSDVTTWQKVLAAQLLFHSYKLFLSEVGKVVRKREDQEPVYFQVADMEAEGEGNIRYIGRLAVRKSLEKSHRYGHENKKSGTKTAREKKVGLLGNDIIVPFTSLNNETIHKETLNATESRQYRERGLLHVTDGAYNLLMKLEQERVDKINVGKLTSTETEIVEVFIKEVCINQCSLRPVYEFVCISFRTDNLNCFWAS